MNAILKKYCTKIDNENNFEQNLIDELKRKIKLSNECLNDLREYIRKNDFPSKQEEIIFFKNQKPRILGRLNFYALQLKYSVEKPKGSNAIKRNYIRKILKNIEARKKRNIDFFLYCSHQETFFDSHYFLRENNQLYLFSIPNQLNKDPLFTTSHDVKASEVITYNLITEFYKKELELIKLKKRKTTIKEVKPVILKDLNWTGTKTDLTELLYGLNAVGAIKNGEAEMKKLVEVCKVLFGIDLGNVYKTFNEIKSREKDPTKFIDLMKNSLIKKINAEQ